MITAVDASIHHNRASQGAVEDKELLPDPECETRISELAVKRTSLMDLQDHQSGCEGEQVTQDLQWATQRCIGCPTDAQ
jgi:hypothetical protein